MNKSSRNKSLFSEKLGTRLASYATMAAAFTAFSPNAEAQCEATSVMPNMPGNFPNGTITQIDFDGDGVVDFAIGSYNLDVNFTTPVCNLVTGPVAASSAYVNPTCGTIQLSYSIKQYYSQQEIFAFNSVYMDPYANAAITVPVGTSGSICAGAGVATMCGLYGLYSSYAYSSVISNSVVQGSIFDAASPACFVTTAILSSNPGPVGPNMNPDFPANPGDGNFAMGQNFIGIEFLAGDGNIYPGWIEVMISDAGTISVVNTGYNPTVDGCIAIGSCETVGACLNDLGLSTSPCDNAGTTGDAASNADDTFTLTINPVGDNTAAGSNYTISGDITANGTYGTPTTVMGIPADGSSISITVTDNTDPSCTLTQQIAAPNNCSFSEDVPTVGEWGLIVLALMMSIIGVVGIRNSQERKVEEYS